jgi:hypothetical protein
MSEQLVVEEGLEIKGPKEVKDIYMWLALKNKVLTWEVLQKRRSLVPGIYYLCI